MGCLMIYRSEKNAVPIQRTVKSPVASHCWWIIKSNLFRGKMPRNCAIHKSSEGMPNYPINNP